MVRAVKGMNDILPAEMQSWHRIEDAFRAVVERYGFGEVRTPLVEPTELFLHSLGDTTDVVQKEMYTFDDASEKSLTLRPEGTASCARAYLEHKVGNLEPVTKWYYSGPMYRRERPAKGRYRQFYQAGCEVYGDPSPFVDAEVIDLVVTFLQSLGIKDIEVQVNSLGGAATRARYREALLDYLRPLADQLSEDSKARLERNPLRVLDSKAPQDQVIAEGAPTLLDYLEEDDRKHFEDLKATLTAFGTPFRVNPRLVRGLDYYTRTLFEVKGLGGDLGAQNTLCGGGRYDTMIGELAARDGGRADVPAVGFAMGIERLLLCMDTAAQERALDCFAVVQASELRTMAATWTRTLRQAGLQVEADLRGNSLKSQFRRADKSNARFALIFGQSEALEGKATLKELATGTQEVLSLNEVQQRLQVLV